MVTEAKSKLRKVYKEINDEMNAFGEFGSVEGFRE